MNRAELDARALRQATEELDRRLKAAEAELDRCRQNAASAIAERGDAMERLGRAEEEVAEMSDRLASAQGVQVGLRPSLTAHAVLRVFGRRRARPGRHKPSIARVADTDVWHALMRSVGLPQGRPRHCSTT